MTPTPEERIGYLESARAVLIERNNRLTDLVMRLSDYACHTEPCAWDTRGGECDCGLSDAIKQAKSMGLQL